MYTLKKTASFENWFNKLPDRTAKMRILARLKNVASGTLGLTRSLGGRISEIKIDYGPGYRLYYTIQGETILLLLLGGDKSKQDKDIAKARQILHDLEEET